VRNTAEFVEFFKTEFLNYIRNNGNESPTLRPRIRYKSIVWYIYLSRSTFDRWSTWNCITCIYVLFGFECKQWLPFVLPKSILQYWETRNE